MVQNMGESVGITSILETLDSAGCGYTIDSFKVGPFEERAIQWVAARPISFGEEQSWPPISEVLEELPKSHMLELGLSNSHGKVKECPFQPHLCPGEHLVASGVGVVRS